jgi:Uma2 family endonuclease
MEAILPAEKLFTVEEYIKFDEENDVRNEFHFGKLYPISGTTVVHNEVIQNLVALLRPEFKKRGCKILHENVKLQLLENGKYNYPDVMLTCDEADKYGIFIVRHPSLIVEVLSKSTATHDRTTKFQDYKGVPSIQYYLLVESRWQYIELFSRTESDNLWMHQSFTKMSDIISFPKLDFQMSVEGIYEDLNIPQKLTTVSKETEDEF